MGAGQLLNCEILMVDKDLDIITKVSLNDFITPEYATLTQQDTVSVENTDSQPRVKLKRNLNHTSSTLVTLKEDEKEKRA